MQLKDMNAETIGETLSRVRHLMNENLALLYHFDTQQIPFKHLKLYNCDPYSA